MECLECQRGNLMCLRFLWWAFMLCSVVSLPLLGREGEGKWGELRFILLPSVFLDLCSQHTRMWWVNGSAGDVNSSLSLVLQRTVPDQLLQVRQHPWDLMVLVFRRKISRAPCNVSRLRRKAWRHWKTGMWKGNFVLLVVYHSTELKLLWIDCGMCKTFTDSPTSFHWPLCLAGLYPWRRKKNKGIAYRLFPFSASAALG